jgi:hypothetical protein
MTRSVSPRGEGSAATAFYLDRNMEKTFVVVRTMPRPCARRIPYGRLQGSEQPVVLRSRWLRQLNGRWGGAWQDAAEALYDDVVQKDSASLGDKKMVTRV